MRCNFYVTAEGKLPPGGNRSCEGVGVGKGKSGRGEIVISIAADRNKHYCDGEGQGCHDVVSIKIKEQHRLEVSGDERVALS